MVFAKNKALTDFKSSAKKQEHAQSCSQCATLAISAASVKRSLNQAAEYVASEFFADNVMNRIFKAQTEAFSKPSLKDYILFRPVFRYVLLGGLLLYPSLARTFM